MEGEDLMVKQTSDSSKISHWSRLHSSTKVLKLDPTPMVLVTTSTCRSTTRMKLGSRDLDIDLSEIEKAVGSLTCMSLRFNPNQSIA